ncbi:hypothetical protein TNIN_460621 [Trichonephila inaurata madagascariensis]|uniref:RRM domain-containing protein n=1 Tax=Trichonephila inaurata madagascariensis TaxID=2747483 RepID=A0A8X6J415_9ARAC|nr:hypothetical protein TNIN_460621 [Trichonephila inaurata madagascariensis]
MFIISFESGIASGGIQENSFPLNDFPENVFNKRKIFVGKLPSWVTKEDMITLFSAYGEVKHVQLFKGRRAINPGYGFVTFNTEEGSSNAIKARSDLSQPDFMTASQMEEGHCSYLQVRKF